MTVTGKLSQRNFEWFMTISPGSIMKVKGLQLFGDDQGRLATGVITADDKGHGYVKLASVERPPPPPKMTEAAYAAKRAEILSGIPEEFHAGISEKAWDDGHAYGYEEVIMHLGDLAEELRPAIEAYTKRIKG